MQENQSQLLRQKQRSDEAAKHLQDEIVRMKTQKVDYPSFETKTKFSAEDSRRLISKRSVSSCQFSINCTTKSSPTNYEVNRLLQGLAVTDATT